MGQNKGAITFLIATMTEAQYESIINEIRDVKRRLDDMESNRDKDMENIQDVRVEIDGIKSELKANRQAINRSSENTKNAVADVVEPVVGALDSFEKQVKKSKMLILKEKSWFQKLFHGKTEHNSVGSEDSGSTETERQERGQPINKTGNRENE